MNKISSRFVLGVLFCGCLLAPVRSMAESPVRKVTVTGMATIKVVPDEMLWTIQISMSDSTLAKAKARHDASLTSVLDYLKGQGASVKNLQTGGIRIDKQTYFPPDSDRTKPFTCATQITFTLIDFDKYGPITDALSKLDGMQVQGVEYASSKAIETQEAALKQALVSAKSKANDLATTANCTLGQPLNIEEGAGESPRPMMKMMAAPARGYTGGTPEAVPGQIEISGAVTATYDLVIK